MTEAAIVVQPSREDAQLLTVGVACLHVITDANAVSVWDFQGAIAPDRGDRLLGVQAAWSDDQRF